MPASPPQYSIALVSAVALAYEILLIRLFSIIQWHHFAYMIISLALLGYGISGTFIALAGRWLLDRFHMAYICNIVLFGLSSVACFLAAQHAPFNPEEILWDFNQPISLLVIYLLLALPFFFASNSVALALARFNNNISRIYSFDLCGAGFGSLGIILLLLIKFPMDSLLLLGSAGLTAAAVAWWEMGLRPRKWMLAFLMAALVLPFLPVSLKKPVISPYKDQSQALRVTGTRIIASRSSPLGVVNVMESPVIPWRYAPGLSINADKEPPPQLRIFSDGNSLAAITHYNGDNEQIAYLDQMTSALPYHIRRPANVLIMGAGGGSGILQALYHNVKHITAVELDPQIIRLVRDDFGEFAGKIFTNPNVDVHAGDARGFVTGSSQFFDLIQAPVLGSFGPSSAGLHALNESYLYTVEALQEYLRHLTPEGYLAISCWVKLPPRDTLKLVATAATALEQNAVSNPRQSLALIRGWQTSTILIKNGVYSAGDIAKLKEFCSKRSFDVVYYDGMSIKEANHYNILDTPYFFLGTQALLDNKRDEFLNQYKFNIRPATDDRPYFFNFMKWRTLPEILDSRGRGGMPLLEWGYLILIATLVQALAASLALILLPLRALRANARNKENDGNISRFRVFAFFFCVGMAFLFLEIAFIRKFILFLHHPLYAAAVMLTAFLFFAGLGSRHSKRFAEKKGPAGAVLSAAVAIVILGLSYLITLEPLFSALITLPFCVRILISIMLVAPLSFCMGMPFPLALAQVGKKAPELIPWAWGVNGCASVISAVLAAVLSVHFGFSAVIVAALLLYCIAAAFFP